MLENIIVWIGTSFLWVLGGALLIIVALGAASIALALGVWVGAIWGFLMLVVGVIEGNNQDIMWGTILFFSCGSILLYSATRAK